LIKTPFVVPNHRKITNNSIYNFVREKWNYHLPREYHMNPKYIRTELYTPAKLFMEGKKLAWDLKN